MAKTKLTYRQLIAIRNAIDFVISDHEKLRWSILGLMSSNSNDRIVQFGLLGNLAAETENLRESKSVISKIYEEQFQE